MYFASHFPYLLNSIVLLAPAGLLRKLPEGYNSSSVQRPDAVTARDLRRLVGEVLEVDMQKGPIKVDHTAAQQRTPTAKSLTLKQATSVEALDITGIVQWQFDNHRGFVHTFADTVRYGPLVDQRSDWTKACAIIRGQGEQPSSGELFNSKVLAIFGSEDSIVVPRDSIADLEEMLGKDHLVTQLVPGAHGFPVPSGKLILQHVLDFWKLG